MGLFKKKEDEEAEANRAANEALREAQRNMESKLKLLLLGTGESGKSTIFKQMRVLYDERDVTEEERMTYTDAVFRSIVQCAQALVLGAESLGVVGDVADQAALGTVRDLPTSSVCIDEEVAAALISLWKDPAIQKVWEQRGLMQVPEAMAYFMANLPRISSADYLATHADFLQARIKSTGVSTAKFAINGVAFEMYDVGGQRSERRKWIHCFEEVNAVIFVSALSEYDQPLYEDKNTNRMMESLDVFSEVLGIKIFRDTPVLLFLNKNDLFTDKIKSGKSPIEATTLLSDETRPWADYTGGEDPTAGQEYFRDKFLARNTDKMRNIYVHVTTATDTGNVKFVFNAAKNIILEQNLDAAGFL